MSFEIIASPDQAEPIIESLTSRQTLEAGCYWRVATAFGAYREGDIHLVTELFFFEEALHTVYLLDHPRNQHPMSQQILLADFLAHFEPVTNEQAELQRAKEQAQVMARVQEIQDDLAKGQNNPLVLESVQAAAQNAVDQFNAQEQARAVAEAQSIEQREQDIRRIHRRASRRSASKGNPLAVRNTTISDNLGVMISEGITQEGTRELALESGRRIAIAKAASHWFKQRTNEISQTLKTLTPYLEEKSHVALAKCSQAIAQVEMLEKGITSLKLYTGESITIVPVKEGASAASSEPLTLLQGKRFMDEELAVWANVEDSFDFSKREEFFAQLEKSTQLLDQVLPMPRCVCTMAVTRRRISYDSSMHWYDKMIAELKNKSVFLLVRNGGNVYAVYSTEPSHEAAQRLFPSSTDASKPFCGVDGSKIGLQDVAFARASKEFDNMALHYKRFLILLAGLDHREQLFGDFYPREESLQFMSLRFQSKYFRFISDDDSDNLLGESTFEDVDTWISRHNKSMQTGSRVVIAHGDTLHRACKEAQRRKHSDFKVDKARMPLCLIVGTSKQSHFVKAPFIDGSTGSRSTPVVWLDGPEASRSLSWFLCVDTVELADVQRFIYSRRQRSGNIAWLRTLRRVESILIDDLKAQEELRQYLSAAAITTGVLQPEQTGRAITTAIATWRAQHSGEAAPAVSDTKNVNQILTLMYPKEQLACSMDELVLRYCAKHSLTPLKLARTGRSKWVLYVTASDEDRAPYAPGVKWGWVKRILLNALKSGLTSTSTSLVWLQKDVQDAGESIVITWPELAQWTHNHAETVRLSWLKGVNQAMAITQSMQSVFAEGRFGHRNAPLPNAMAYDIIDQMRTICDGVKSYPGSYIAFCLGLYQPTSDVAPVFVYATTKTAHFMTHYGSAAEIAEYARYAHTSRAARSELHDKDMKWTLLCSRVLQKNLVFSWDSDTIFTPKWSAIEAGKRGGTTKKCYRDMFMYGSKRSTRRERRENGRQSTSTVTRRLSWNRAFDSLMGTAPHLRTEFNKEQAQAQHQPFFSRNNNKPKVFSPQMPVAFHFLPMVWDESKRRSMASRLFWQYESTKSVASVQ